MASSLRSFAAALLFVMLFMPTEMGRNTIMVAEAKLKPGQCEKKSVKYEGVCLMSDSCRMICIHDEGSLGGHCIGDRCMCVKRC